MFHSLSKLEIGNSAHGSQLAPITVNTSRFIIGYPQASNDSLRWHIHEFNFDKDEWSKFTTSKYDKSSINITNYMLNIPYHSIGLNEISNNLYIVTDYGILTKTNLINKESKTITMDQTVGKYSIGMVINGSFHVIGGQRSNKHFVFDDKTKQLKQIHVFDEFPTYFIAGGIVYINRMKSLFCFGGHSANAPGWLDTIFKFDCHSKWSKLPIKMPKQLTNFGITSAINEQYILIFGGYANSKWHDDILVFSLARKTFTKSNVKCKNQGVCRAITINEKKKNELTTFGFVREQWNSDRFSGLSYPPYYLIKLMSRFYLTEYVYLLQSNYEFFKISTFDIVPH